MHSQTEALIVGSNSSGVSSNVTTSTNFYYTIVGYGNTDSNNTLTISGSAVTVGNVGGTVLPFDTNYDASITVGNFGNGNQMIVSNGASVTALQGLGIGLWSPSSSNTVTVTGSNSSLNITGGIYLGNDSNTSGNQLIINNYGTVTDTNSADTTALVLGSGTGANSNTVTVSGNGLLNLNTNQIYIGASTNSIGNQLVVSGAGTVTSGASKIGSVGAANNSALVTGAASVWSINSGASNNVGLYVGDSASGNSLTISNGGALNVIGDTVIGTDISLPGSPGSNNSVLVTGAGSAISNSGAITVGSSGGGTLTVAEGGSVTASAIYVAASNNSVGTLNIGAFGANGAAGTLSTANIFFGSGTGTLNFNQSNTTTLGANISGNGSVNQEGSGITILTGSNTYSGPTTITNGTLQLGDGSTNTSGFLRSIGSGAISNNGTLAFDQYNTFTVSNTISGNGALVQGAAGTTILAANNTYSGGTVITNGFLQVGTNGSSGSLGSGGVSLSNSATLIYDRGNSSTLSNAITGTGNMAFVGGGTTTLSGNSTYNGFTYVTAGTVDVTGSISNASTRVNVGTSNGYGYNNATLIFTNGGLNTASSLNIGDYSGGNSNKVIVTGATLTLQTNTSGSIGIGGFGASDNSLQITNGGQMISGNVNVGFAGGSNNSLSIGGTGSSLRADGTAVGYFVGSNSSYNSVLVSAGGSLTTIGSTFLSYVVGDSNNTVLVTDAGSLWSNSAAITVGANGSASLTLANGGAVDASTLNIAASNSSVGIVNVGTYGANGVGGTLTASNIAFGSGAGTVNFNQSNAVSIGAAIGGNGSLNQLGTGTTTLTGNNNGFSGLTTISQGTLRIGDGIISSTSVGSGNFSNNASLVLNPISSANYTVAGQIGGSGTVTMSGAGTATLTGNNTYVGGTLVNEGTLLVNNTSGSGVGSGNLAVASGATLGGDGIIGGASTINSGGNLTPGLNGLGALTFTNGLTLSAGATTTMALTSPGAYSSVNVKGGVLSYNGNLVINFSNYTPVAGNTFTLFNMTNGATQLGNLQGVELTNNLSGTWYMNDNAGNWTIGAAGVEWEFSQANGELTTYAIPEPSTYVLLSLGLITLLVVYRRRSRI